ncbi:agmatine deiminase family protein [Sphingobacterium thalpophilum]|uniref:agmatine deiminase family protein n=1 Tax=Sphingobacterium thalpophilum TaxID=259 RepID=UPI002D77245F|nr:agmatine deiminase family protein [Sphingobacterium thalpophilum]
MNCEFKEVENIILSYPRSFRNDFNKVTSVIEELIRKIPKNINIKLISSSPQDLNILFDKIGNERTIESIIIKSWDEIWLKDCIGFINNNKLVKPIYFPMYCDYRFRWKYFKKINQLSKEIITSFIGKEMIDIPLIWDGGNLINNHQYGFMTSKIIEDNPTFSKYYIEKMIEEYLSIKPIIIQRQHDDAIGHIDGFASFVNDRKLAISLYPNMPFLKEDNVYLDRILSIANDVGIETMRIHDRPIDQSIKCQCKKKKRSGCYSVSRGIYINNIMLNDTVILPQYTLPTKKETDFYNLLNKALYENEGFKVETVNCDALSQFGGSLHCLSFVY